MYLNYKYFYGTFIDVTHLFIKFKILNEIIFLFFLNTYIDNLEKKSTCFVSFQLLVFIS